MLTKKPRIRNPQAPLPLRRSLRALASIVFLFVLIAPLDAQQAQARAGDIPIWRTSALPTFDSQSDELVAEALLLSISGLARLQDGTVVVADNGATNIKFFAADGRLLRTVGREGAGPGEYKTPRLLGMCGTNHLHVYDGALGRITVLALDGSLLDTWRIGMSATEHQPPMHVVCGPGRDAILLGWPADYKGPVTKPVAHRSEIRMSSRTMTRDGATTALGRVMGPERQQWPGTDGPRTLGKETFVAIGSDRLYIGTGDSSTIDVRSRSGQHLSSVPLPYKKIRIDDDYIRAFVDRVIALNPNRRPDALRKRYVDMEFPEYFPAHGALLLDSAENLWVERYRLPGETTSRWSIFDRAGRPVSMVDLPEGFRLLQAGTREVVGTWEDDDGVLHVRVYALRR